MVTEAPFPRSSWILAAVAVAFFLLAAGHWSGFLIDDTFNSLRYARNLAAGEGLVFNAGERVEGYTNFLWVLLAAAATRLGADPMLALRFVSALASATILILIGRRHGPLALALLAAAPAFAFWSVTGMETALFAGLLLLAWTVGWQESVRGRRLGSVALFLLLALTRPEGAALFALCHALFWAAEGCSRSSFGRHAVDALLFAAGYGVYFAWRLAYYGSLFPNTYHAKVTGDAAQWRTGWKAAVEWAAAHPIFAASLLVVAGLLLAPTGRRELLAERQTLAVGGLCLAWCAYVVGIGGDFMPFFRFFLPVAPFFALLTARVLVLLAPRRAVTLAAASMAALQVVTTLRSDQPERAFVAHRTTVVGAEVGRTFAELYDPGDWLAVNTAGSLPYHAGLPTIDMLGLTDEAIARHPVYVISTGWAGHRRGWGASVVSRRPRAVVWYNTGGLARPHYLSDHQLAEDPFFRFFYQRKARSLEVPGERRGEVLAHFLGAPFGRDSVIGDLGARFEVSARPFPHTLARADAVKLVWFERRADPDDLWSVFDATGRDVGRFLDGAVARWRTADAAATDPEARRRVEELCDRAAGAVERGRVAEAKELLARASRLGPRAETPRLYQYVANLAALENDVFLAVQAQREALRLDPDNGLYRRNLAALMLRPFETP